MKPGLKLAAFAVVLAVAFGGGAALGAVFEPDKPAPHRMDRMDRMDQMPGMEHPDTSGRP